MRKNSRQRNTQLLAAQTTYRTRKKIVGATRLQTWIGHDAKQSLENLSKITGKTQQESIEYAINLAYQTQTQQTEVSNEF